MMPVFDLGAVKSPSNLKPSTCVVIDSSFIDHVGGGIEWTVRVQITSPISKAFGCACL